MNKIISKIITLIITIITSIFLLISCVTVGKTFSFQNKEQLRLGVTTIQEAIQLIGSPTSRNTNITATHKFETINFASAKANLGGATARALTLEFKDNLLNGKVYNSGFKEDDTAFDFLAYQDILVGKSVQEEVLDRMGMPSGMVSCPTKLYDGKIDCEQSEAAWIWANTAKSKGLTIKTEIVIIIFDEQRVVKQLKLIQQ